MRFTSKAGLALALLVAVAPASVPARAQTLGAPGDYSGSVSPAPPRWQEASWPGPASLDAATYSWPGEGFAGSILGVNPLLPRNDAAFDALGLSPLLIPGFTHSAFAGVAPAWNDDLRLWINGLGTFDPGAQRSALYANVVYGGVSFGGIAPGQALEDER